MANLTAADRKKIPTGKFALPEKRAYPVEDAAHARAALSRASANATPAEQARIKRKVKEMYPSIQVNGMKDSKK